MLKCRACQGQKHVLGMGNMREPCKTCNAKGFMENVVVIDKEPAAEIFEKVIPVVKSKKPKEKGHVGQEDR